MVIRTNSNCQIMPRIGSVTRGRQHIRDVRQWNLLCSIVILFCCLLIKSTSEAKKYHPLAHAKLADQYEEVQVVSGGSETVRNSSYGIQHRKSSKSCYICSFCFCVYFFFFGRLLLPLLPLAEKKQIYVRRCGVCMWSSNERHTNIKMSNSNSNNK